MAGKSKPSPDRTDSGRFIALTPELLALADELQREFIAYRRTFVADAPGCSKAQRPYFLKAAIYCRRDGLDAAEYVQNMCIEALHHGKDMVPRLLADKALIQAMKDREPERRRLTEVKYRTQYGYVMDAVERGETPDYVCTIMPGIGSLMRYYVATVAGRTDLMSRFEKAAWDEYAANDIARQIFGREVFQ